MLKYKERIFFGVQDTISGYLIDRLYEHGVRHAFGVPGDYVLAFYDQLHKSSIKIINTCDEQGAGFAADAYARLNGLGLVCVTYGVGGLKIVNTTAQAYAEKSPVVVLSGAPGVKEQEKDPLLHHKVRDFDTQKKVFEQVTVASTVLSDSQTAVDEIERVLAAAIQFKRPVYIELPRDMVMARIGGHIHQRNAVISRTDQTSLAESLQEAAAMINKAKRPVILAGEEVHRFGLQDSLLEFVDRTKIPVASTILSKSVINELNPAYIGIYQGAVGEESVRRYVETSDCIIILGAMLTDLTLGMFSARIDKSKLIFATSEKISIKHHHYEGVLFADFIKGLSGLGIKSRQQQTIFRRKLLRRTKASKKPVTIRYMIQALNEFLKDDMIVITDVGDALFASTELVIRGKTQFLSPAYYASLGFAVPACVGAQTARPDLRPLVLVGDGAFQMTGTELTSAGRYGLNPIVVVLNNGGYLTERLLLDGSFNDLVNWDYASIPNLIGKGRGFSVLSEEDLDKALAASIKEKQFCILDVRLDPADMSKALRRLTAEMAKKVR